MEAEAEWLDRARQLRAEAWDAVQASSAYVAFKRFDDLVVDMGGTSLISENDAAASWKSTTLRAVDAAARRLSDQKKLSQGDAAEIVLRQVREPLPVARLLEAVVKRGVAIGGADPLSNFRSSISKDDRFYALRKGSLYFWWLKGQQVPPAWQEPSSSTEFDDLLGGSEPHETEHD